MSILQSGSSPVQSVPRWSVRVHGDPSVQSDGFEVYDETDGTVDSWHRWCGDATVRMYQFQDEAAGALQAEHARYSPETARLFDPVPAEGDGDAEPVDGDSLDYWSEVGRTAPEWWHDLGRDMLADPYGDDGSGEPFDLDGEPEHVVVERAMEGSRRGSTRVDAEEESAMWGR